MKTIWKFNIPHQSLIEIEMPHGAQVLKAECQGESPCLWAIVDPALPVTRRRFLLFGTGHPMGEDISTLKFVDTFQQGPFVWHLFEVTA